MFSRKSFTRSEIFLGCPCLFFIRHFTLPPIGEVQLLAVRSGRNRSCLRFRVCYSSCSSDAAFVALILLLRWRWASCSLPHRCPMLSLLWRDELLRKRVSVDCQVLVTNVKDWFVLLVSNCTSNSYRSMKFLIHFLKQFRWMCCFSS